MMVMSNRHPPLTPGDRREDHATQASEAIGAIYAQAELIIIATIAAIARKLAAGAMLPNVAVRQVRATVAAVLSRAAPQARQVLTTAVNDASAQVQNMIAVTLTAPAAPAESARPVPIPAQWTDPIASLIDQAADTAAQSAEDTIRVFTGAVSQVKDTTTAVGRLAIAAAPARRALMPPPPPDNPYMAALGRAFGHFNGFPGQSLSYRRLQAAQEMLDGLAANGITGFTDKAGRNWDLATYAEMATRTAVSSAWDDMQADAAIRSGLDLVETGTHSTEGSCPLCIPWLGRKLSLTGATAGYDTIEDAKAAGWRHPNCRCFWWVIGGGYMTDVANPVPIANAAAVYASSQKQRALERHVRAAGRAAQAAITPQAKARARRDLAAARAASAAHRQQHQLRMMKVTVERRERPHGPR
jgi:hypothetical protein